MTTPVWYDVFLDVPRAGWQRSVEFWAAATGLTPSPARGEDGQFLTLLPGGGTSCVRMQAIDGGPRVHLDVASHDRDALLQRALGLGATRAWHYHDVPVLRSPGGLLLCLTLAEPEPHLARTGEPILDQVCLDIPPSQWETEVAFWHQLTGRDITTGRSDPFVRLVDPDPAGGLRFLLQRLDEDRPTVSAHADIAVADRPAEVARHRELGAEQVAEHQAWTIMRAPEGHIYCLTDRDPGTGHPRP
ncbi:VOC family protein [Pseudactinotalea suaedae]|uniref:VOC family protein n=1 Tax=Pseudactinotalea suaedae TaxID=1524924 RepID=UPI0012E221AC|nr:VOC family protein [Pseudactinotalea suaedae]